MVKIMANVDSLTRKEDPQIVVTGMLKEGERSDIIVFSIPLGFIELVCIVTVPGQGTTAAPVYVKIRVRT